MGKQINYYMEYACFLRLAEKALELGCEIIRNEHAAEISRGFSADIVTPDCIHYYFYVPDAGALSVQICTASDMCRAMRPQAAMR